MGRWTLKPICPVRSMKWPSFGHLSVLGYKLPATRRESQGEKNWRECWRLLRNRLRIICLGNNTNSSTQFAKGVQSQWAAFSLKDYPSCGEHRCSFLSIGYWTAVSPWSHRVNFFWPETISLTGKFSVNFHSKSVHSKLKFQIRTAFLSMLLSTNFSSLLSSMAS